MNEFLAFGLLAFFGWRLYVAGKRSGSRRAFGAGFRRGRRRRRN